MKKMKFAALFAALISVISLSSCLNDSSSDGYDGGAVVSLKSYLGSYYYITDDGVSLFPENTNVLAGLKLKDGTYLERFYGVFKLSEGEAISPNKTSYKISELAISDYIVYQPMTTMPDTIKANHGIQDIDGKLWAANGYLNIPVLFFTSPTSKVNAYDFQAYATGASKDTLFVTLQQSRNIEANDYPVTSPQLLSFSMPFGKSDFENIFRQVQPKNDTLVIKVSAKVHGKNVPIVRTTKYKASQR